jgi:uncharacterized membrane protein YeiH
MQDKYILTAIAGAAVALVVGRWYRKSDGIVVFLDSIAMSLFAIAGTYKGVLFDTSFIVAILLGVLTAVGGGILRDVVCRITPQIFTGGPLYATATALGSALFFFLEKSSLDVNFGVAIAAITIITIHMTSVKFRIHLKPALSGLDFERPAEER